MVSKSKHRAEEHYLDALDALESGDRSGALDSARHAVKLDPEHDEGWWLISTLELPEKGGPGLTEASRSLAACRKVVAINPANDAAWVRGGQLLADELGMYFDAMEWWQRRRELAPSDSVAIVEQSALLADFGMYGKAAQHLNSIIENNLDVTPQQHARISRLAGLLHTGTKQDPIQHFRPWERRHPAWNGIDARRHKGPVSESMLFLMFVTPFLVLEVWFSRGLTGGGFWPFCLTSLIILATVGMGIRFTRNLFYKVNRPAFDLLRAMDLETSTGCLVIPEEVRTDRLYMSILQRRPAAYQARSISIVEEGMSLPKGWKPPLPDFDLPMWDDEDEDDWSDSDESVEVPGLDAEE